MPKHPDSAPIFYLLATDARFFASLWQHASQLEQSDCKALHTLARARCSHRVHTLSEQPVHTAEVCFALTELGLNTEIGLAPMMAAQMHVTAAHDDIEQHSPATWMRLTPVYWAAARDHVNLHELGGDNMDADDWAALLPDITPWLRELGWEVFAGEHLAFIRAPHGFDYHAPSLKYAQSDMLEAFLPHGHDLKKWQTLLTEFQMLLHTHKVNTSREQRGAMPINSFWLDQGATAASCAPIQHTNVAALLHPNIPALDYNLNISELNRYLSTIADAINTTGHARLRIISDVPHACVYEFEFSRKHLGARLLEGLRRVDSKPPFDWLTPALMETQA